MVSRRWAKVAAILVILAIGSCRQERKAQSDLVDQRGNDEVTHWKDLWWKGDRTEQEQALQWVYREYLKPGMPKEEVERFLGPGVRAIGTGNAYAYLPRDECSKYLLCILYETDGNHEVVKTFDLVPDYEKEERDKSAL